MSELETNPLNNTTIQVENPNQIMVVKPTVQITNFSYDGSDRISVPRPFSLNQLDWIQIAAKNKYFDSFDWNVGDVGIIRRITITPQFIRTNLIPLGTNFNTWFDYKNVLMSIKSAANPYYAGLLMVSFLSSWNVDPTNVKSAKVLSIRDLFQVPHVFISPKTSGEVNFLVPLNYPFEAFRNKPQGFGSAQTELELFMDNYVFGHIIISVLSPLATTSSKMKLTYTFSGQVLDLSTSGAIFTTSNP